MAAASDLILDTGASEGAKRVGDQTVTADLVAWKGLAVEKQNTVPARCQVGGCDATSRPGSDHDDVPGGPDMVVDRRRVAVSWIAHSFGCRAHA